MNLPEIELLNNSWPQSPQTTNVIKLLAEALSTGNYAYLDLEKIKSDIVVALDAYIVYKKYASLKEKCGNQLTYTTESFIVYDVHCQTLAEVEKVIANKVFV